MVTISYNLLELIIRLFGINLPLYSSVGGKLGVSSPSLGMLVYLAFIFYLSDKLFKYGLSGCSQRLYMKMELYLESFGKVIFTIFTPKERK